MHKIDYYLNKIPSNINSLVMNLTNVPEVENMIQNIPNKSSHGHDSISNTLLKQLCKSISFPLCGIFNQSIAEGKFPSQMKRT